MDNKSSSHVIAQKIANPEACTYGQRTLEMTQIFMSVISFQCTLKDLKWSKGNGI